MIDSKVQPIRHDLDVAISGWLGPQARGDILRAAAAESFAEADAINAAALGGRVPFTTFVDGRPSDTLAGVSAGSVITRVYDLMPHLVATIFELLWDHSPVRTGAYQASHRLLADGNEVATIHDDWSAIPLPAGARELVFVPTVNYARPIEGGWSKQAPDGVYQVIAALMREQFSRVAIITFGYRELAGVRETRTESAARPNAPRDLRQPAIIIRPV